MSTGATQHWILLSDTSSIQQLNTILRSSNRILKKYLSTSEVDKYFPRPRSIITKHLTMNLVTTYPGRTALRPVPRLVLDYVDLDTVAAGEEEAAFIAALQSFLMSNLQAGNGKYLDKLFYVGPLYHRIFPSLKKLIFMDVGKH